MRKGLQNGNTDRDDAPPVSVGGNDTEKPRADQRDQGAGHVTHKYDAVQSFRGW